MLESEQDRAKTQMDSVQHLCHSFNVRLLHIFVFCLLVFKEKGPLQTKVHRESGFGGELSKVLYRRSSILCHSAGQESNIVNKNAS